MTVHHAPLDSPPRSGPTRDVVEDAAEMIRRHPGDPVAAARRVVELVDRDRRDRVDDLERELTAERTWVDAVVLQLQLVVEAARGHELPDEVRHVVAQCDELIADRDGGAA